MNALAFFSAGDTDLCSGDAKILDGQCRIGHQQAIGYYEKLSADGVQGVSAFYDISA